MRDVCTKQSTKPRQNHAGRDNVANLKCELLLLMRLPSWGDFMYELRTASSMTRRFWFLAPKKRNLRETTLMRADAGPAAPTLRSAQRSVRSRWASFVEIRGDSGAPLNARVARGGPLAARWQCHQSGSTVWCAQPNPTRQPTHELTVSTGTENSDRYGTASDEMRFGLSSGTLPAHRCDARSPNYLPVKSGENLLRHQF